MARSDIFYEAKLWLAKRELRNMLKGQFEAMFPWSSINLPLFPLGVKAQILLFTET